MPNLDAYIGLDIKFDLTGNPKLVLTDPNSYPGGVAATLVGYFKITQPDGIPREGNYDSPDIEWNGSALPPFEYNLRRDANQEVQQGEYTIEYHAYATGYTPTVLTRRFTFTYDRVTQELEEDFDVFTPDLKYRDNTNYDDVSGWSLSSGTPITDTWEGVIAGVGTVTDSDTATFDLAYGGSYYDALYTITRVKEVLYESVDYEWLTVQDKWEEEIDTEANTPCSVDDLVECIDDLFNEYYTSSCDAQVAAKAKYEFACSLHHHLIEKLRLGLTTYAYQILETLQAVTACSCAPSRGSIIQPYDLSGESGSGDLYYNYFMLADVTEITLSALASKNVKAIDMDGIGRYIIDGVDSDTPADGSFIFVSASGKFKYGGTLYTGAWLRIKYTNF